MSKPFSLDFKNFKKLNSDKHTTTLKHPDGHEIKIAHSALSPKHKEMLSKIPTESPKKMADGGEVSSEPSTMDRLKETMMGAKDKLQAAQQEYLEQQRKLFGLGDGPVASDEERQGIANQMGTNVAMGTIGSPYSKVPIKGAAERMLPAAEEGYKEASQLFDAATKGATIPLEGGMRPAPLQQMSQSNATPMQQVQRQMNKAGGKRYADGGEVDDPNVSPDPNRELIIDKVDESQIPPTENQLMVEKVPEETSQAESAPSPQISQENAQEAPTAPKEQTSAPEQNGEDNLSVNPTAGYQDQLKGLDEQYKAEKSLAALKQHDYQKTVDQTQKSLGYLKQATDDYHNEWNQISHEIQSKKINPEDYWQNHSKVATALGIILAGFSPTSAPNAAIDMLKYHMDENMRAQLANLNSKHNLIAASTQKYGNLREGIQAAQIMQTQMLAHKLDMDAAKAADPMAKAKMLELSGQLKLQAAPQIMKFNVMQGAMKAQQDGNAGQYLHAMRFVDPAMAKEMESRFVPDANNPQKGDFATIPIPEKPRDEMVARAGLQEQAHNLRQWAKSHSGELRALNPSDVNYGKALAAAVQDAYRRANGQGVFREAEAEFVKGIVSDDPTAFFNKVRVDPKYKALEDSNLMQLNSVRKGYGLPPKGADMVLSPQDQNLVKIARSMPNSVKAKMFLKSKGME